MNFGEWQAQLQEVPGYDGHKLYLFRRLSDRSIEFLTENGKAAKVKEGQLDTGDNHFAFLTREQTQSIADAFANKGIRTVNDSKNAGLLEATKYHLEDMRRIAFEPAHTEVITTASPDFHADTRGRQNVIEEEKDE